MSLLKAFEGIQKNFKFKPKHDSIDNEVFKLHYRVTVLIFCVATVLVTSQQYIGEHIRCISDNGVPENVLNTFCFFTTTFTVIKYLDSEAVDAGNVAHPGVGPYGMNSTEPVQIHAYYQWVPYMLFAQAVMFYLTHLLWKTLEGGKIQSFARGLRNAEFSFLNTDVALKHGKISSKEHSEEFKRRIKDAFDAQSKNYVNFWWAMSLVLCEILNVVHVLFQFYITNLFLDNQFYNLGAIVVRDGLDSSVDILDKVFPKVTKCTFHKYGPSGSIQSHDAMCVMALNIINDKIYTFLWFWFIFLFGVSVINVLWRILAFLLHSRSMKFNKLAFGMYGLDNKNPWDQLEETRKVSFIDWLFLKYLSRNIDHVVFSDILKELAEGSTSSSTEEKTALLKGEKNAIQMSDENNSSRNSSFDYNSFDVNGKESL